MDFNLAQSYKPPTLFFSLECQLIRFAPKEYDMDKEFLRLIETVDAIGAKETYTYNSKGLIKEVTNSRNQTTKYTYDVLGRIKTLKDEEGTIEYWKNAIAFYDKLDDKDKEILFSIIKSTIVDTVSNVLAVLDGHEDIDRINVQVKLNGQENDSELQDAFLAYVEDLDE